MAIESFDVEDENGVRVTGTVEAFRKRNGDYYDPNSPSYHNERHADVDINYLNTRDVCRINPEKLRSAVAAAFARALIKFGIPDPKMDNVDNKVGDLIKATREQCALHPDKYVSNQTSLAVDTTGRPVGDVTTRAYAAVPDGTGGLQTVVARENKWPATATANFERDDAFPRFRRDANATRMPNAGNVDYQPAFPGIPSSSSSSASAYKNEIDDSKTTSSSRSGLAPTASSNPDPSTVRRLSSPILGIVPAGANQPQRATSLPPGIDRDALSFLPRRSPPDAMRMPDGIRASGDLTQPLPFYPATLPPQDTPGGLLGLMAQVGAYDPSNPDQPPAGGLLKLMQEWMRNNPDGGAR